MLHNTKTLLEAGGLRPGARTKKPPTSNLQPDAALGLAPDTLRLGLFGGTFNPIHLGHLRAAMEIEEAFSLDRVLFIPAAVPPHKTPENVLPFSRRSRMVRLAIAGHPSFRVSDVEQRSKGKSYSIRTLRYFHKVYGRKVDLFFILGLDAFGEINTWKDYQQLFPLSHFVVMDRPGYRRSHLKEFLRQEIASDFVFLPKESRFLHPSGHSVYFFSITLMDISSTLIRNLRKRGRSIRYLLPQAVEDYILGKKFYEN